MDNKKEIIINSVEVIGKTVLSSIPVGGTLFTSIWDAIKDYSINKRYEDWQKKVEDRLSKVEESIENIGNNDMFTTAMIYATEQALKTSSEKKREYLANAVINSINIDIEESIILIYFDMIAKYSELHLFILNYYDNPREFVKGDNYIMGSAKKPLYDIKSSLKDNDEIVDRIINDLYQDGVLTSNNFNINVTGDAMLASKTTEFGRKFISFITGRK